MSTSFGNRVLGDPRMLDAFSAVEVPNLTSLNAVLYESELSSPEKRFMYLEEGQYVTMFGLSGAVFYQGSPHHPAGVTPAPGVLTLFGPCQVRLHYGRGVQQWVEIAWTADELGALASWVQGQLAGKDPQIMAVGTSFDAWLPEYTHFKSRLVQLLQPDQDAGEPKLLGLLADAVALQLTKGDSHALAGIQPDLPATLKMLMEHVQSDPTKSWALKHAAVLAGYSPFHLSRSFRQAVGYGFPEFVDRTRTAMAVGKMISQETQVDDVSGKCGFGSSQGLRESCKEYLGFLPSEIRQLALDPLPKPKVSSLQSGIQIGVPQNKQ